MLFTTAVRHAGATLALLSVSLIGPAAAQRNGDPAPAAAPRTEGAQYQLAGRANPVLTRPRFDFSLRDPNEHPLMPAIRWAHSGQREMEKVADYSAVIYKRERVNGKLGDYNRMFIKIRHKPFSVYLYFLAPDRLKGQEVIYVEGANDGKMIAHGVGIQKLLGAVPLDPTGRLAMNGNRYPITEIGLMNLTRRLIEIAEHDAQYGECEVKFIPKATIRDRTATCIQVLHPVPRRNFRFHVARIYVDDEMNIPVRYESWDWPKRPGEKAQLIEEYTYTDIRLNNGFTDEDFDAHNPNYGFYRQ